MERKDKDYMNKKIVDFGRMIDRRIDEQFKDHEKTSWGHNFWIGTVIFVWLIILTLGLVVAGNQFAGMEWHCSGDKVTVYEAVCHIPRTEHEMTGTNFPITGDKDSFDLNVKNCQENGWGISDFTMKEVCTGYEYLMRT